MTVVIAAQIDFQPGRRDQALADAAPLIAACRAEDGCVNYAWSADPALPARVHVFEEWASEAALAAHFRGKPFAGMGALLQTSGLVNAQARKYRVDLIEPVYDPNGAPRADFFTTAPLGASA